MKSIFDNYRFYIFKLWVKRLFNIYPYLVEHEGDGIYDHDWELFEEQKPWLLKTLKRIKRTGILPNVDGLIEGDGHLYYIKTITFHEDCCKFWVDEEEDRGNTN